MNIGVNENVLVAKAEKNDKGTLEITFSQLGGDVKDKKKASSLAEQMGEGSDTSGNDGDGQRFMMFKPTITTFDDPDKVKEGKDIFAAFMDLKNQLAHILLRFGTEKSVKFSPFAGTGVSLTDDAKLLAAMETEAVCEKVYENLVSQFMSQIKPFLNREDKLSRLFLVRKSADSNFSVLRKKYLGNQPFFEDMAIPVNVSKMYTKKTDKATSFHEPIEVEGIKYVPAFTEKYEIKNGLDDPSRREVSADATAASEAEVADAGALFSAEEDDAPAFKLEE